MLSDVKTPELDSEDPPVWECTEKRPYMQMPEVKSQQSPKLSVKMTKQKESGNQEDGSREVNKEKQVYK